MPATRRDSGFTLLELIVAVSLTAVVLLILLNGLRLTERAWTLGNDKVTTLEGRLAEREAIQVQVSSAVPRVVVTEYEQQQVHLISFCGNTKEIRLLSNYSWEGGRSFGLWLVKYRVVQKSDGKEQLMVTETGLTQQKQLVDFLLSKEPTGGTGQPFGEGANQIEFSYWRPNAPGIPASWVPEWKCDSMNQLPRSVHIHWQGEKEEQNLLLLIPVVEETK